MKFEKESLRQLKIRLRIKVEINCLGPFIGPREYELRDERFNIISPISILD